MVASGPMPGNRRTGSGASSAAALGAAAKAERASSCRARSKTIWAAAVESAWNDATRGVLLASPSNPAGTTVLPDELRRICLASEQRGGFAIIDEIYGGLVYEDAPACALSHSPDAIVVGGFSKYFCMTGWRLGWLVAPEDLVREIEKLAQNAYVSPPTAAQYAALAAIDSHPGLDQTELCHLIAIDRSTVGDVVTRLERKKLIRRTAGAEDRRTGHSFRPHGECLGFNMGNNQERIGGRECCGDDQRQSRQRCRNRPNYRFAQICRC